MSSTSSNECTCDQTPYGVWADTTKSPWYPTHGHPLVYYSKVQPVRRRKRSKESENDKQNCFQRAFRWYTQERLPIIKTDAMVNANNADIKGFAAWLDEKYDEFLQSNERTQYVLTQTAKVDTDRTTNYKLLDKVEKKHKKTKSPWKRCRKHSNTAEKGDIIVRSRSNHSVKIILKPKDLSRPASECCLRTKAQICRNHSTSTVESYASTPQRVTKVKSRSLNSIVKEKEIYTIPFDGPEHVLKQETYREGYEYDRPQDPNTPKEDSTQKKYQTKDVSCQCSKDMSAKVEAANQFEYGGIKGTNSNYWKEQNIKGYNLCGCNEKNTKANSLQHKRSFFEHRYIETNPIISKNNGKPTLPKTEPVYSLRKEESGMSPNTLGSENKRTLFLSVINDSVQTSDHSINLNQMYPEYPLFVKVICADKLRKN